ncbi:MAG: outer membrane beta-barrel family protein [Pedobacter sp.]
MFAFPVKGQSMATEKVTVGLKNENIEDAIRKIEGHSRLRFYYRLSDVKSIGNLNVRKESRTIEQLLNLILQNTVLSFRQIDKNILIERLPQNPYQIVGVVKDSLKNELVQYATITLQDSLGKGLKSNFTDINGKFQFDSLANRHYKISIASIGYENRQVDVLTNPKLQLRNLGILLVYAANVSLKQVNVVGTRPILKQEIDRLTYDVQADPESKIRNVLDVMRKIPLISVDAEDEIRLKGSPNYRIFINGNPSSMMAKSPKDVLRSMSASNIQKIEVITTPPAKYEGEGLAGIINIITNKNIENGYSGNINSSYRLPVGGISNSGSLIVQKGKFGASLVGGITNYNSPNSDRFSDRTTTGVNPTFLSQDRVNNFDSQYRYLTSLLSFEIDSLNLFSGEISINNGSYKSHNDQNSRLFDQSNSIVQSYSVENLLINPWTGLDVGLNYQLVFKKKKDKLLTLSYKLSNTTDNTDYSLTLDNQFNYPASDFLQINNSKAFEQTIQLDYVNVFGNLKIESGIKGIFRENESDYQYSSYDESSSSYQLQADKSNIFSNDQNIYGIYNSYLYSKGHLSIQAGGRLEHTTLRSIFSRGNAEVKDEYYNLIPAISSTLKFDENNQALNIGYTRRIQRPNIWNLNPFVDRSNPSIEVAGNPNLRPVKSNNLLMNYSNFKKLSLNIGVGYSFANNTIQQVYTYDDATGITRTTYDNIGKERQLGLDFNVSYPITAKFIFSTGGNLSHLWLEGLVDNILIKNKGLKGIAFGKIAYNINQGMHLNADVNYQSANITLQGRFRPNVYSSFSIDKALFKSKLFAAASISNPFGKFRDFSSVTQGNDFTQTNTSVNYFRAVTFSLNYKFGKSDNSIKKNVRSINNDDSTGGKP